MIQKAIFLLAVFLAYSSGLVAQDVQWAASVIDFSSELTSVQYAAMQATGKPNVLPQGGENPNAWTPNRPKREEYLVLGYSNPMQVSQVIIAETYNPSAVKEVVLIDTRDVEHPIFSLNPQRIQVRGRALTFIFDKTQYEVKAVRVELDGEAIDDYYSIDAVGISGSKRPVTIDVEVVENLNPDLVSEGLGENVNSSYKEYKPLLSPDGKMLFFSRQFHPENIGGVEDPEDIWYSELDENGEWSLAQNAGPVLNTEGPNYVSSVTPDGNSMVILLGNKYKSNGKLEAGVSLSNRVGDSWSKPVALEIENEYNYSDKSNYYMSNNRRVLLMSVERLDTEGDRDLYVSFIRDDSTWTEPLNLGSVINTAGEEASPFLAADNQTLYFASNGFPGYGGLDIYVSERLDDTWTNWSEPRNMGPEINTADEDMFFYIPVSGSHAYYSRGVSQDNTDIHQVELPVFIMPKPVIAIKGNLKDAKTGEPLEATIRYQRVSDGEELGMVNSLGQDGEFEILLPAGESYAISAEVEGYLPLSENIDLTDADGEVLIMRRELELVPIEKEATIVLNNIFFAFDRSDLRPESYPELDRVTAFLLENENIDIELSGHTDNVGSESYNEGLSKRRVESVQRYFRNKGIENSRMVIKWYGESRPVASNETEEGRRKNRRVEFKIINE